MTLYKNGAYLTATGQAYTGQGKLKRAILYSGTAGGASWTLYDNTSGTTNPLTKVSVDTSNLGGEDEASECFEIGREFETGVRCVLVGTGALTLVF
jgi:hypothetical protein